MKIYEYIFGGSLRNRTILFYFIFLFIYLFFFFFWGGGSFLYILGLFKVKIQNWNIFLGMPDIPDFFFFLGGGGVGGGVNRRCWVQAFV